MKENYGWLLVLTYQKGSIRIEVDIIDLKSAFSKRKVKTQIIGAFSTQENAQMIRNQLGDAHLAGHWGRHLFLTSQKNCISRGCELFRERTVQDLRKQTKATKATVASPGP